MSRIARVLLIIALVATGCSLVTVARPAGTPTSGVGQASPVVIPVEASPAATQ